MRLFANRFFACAINLAFENYFLLSFEKKGENRGGGKLVFIYLHSIELIFWQLFCRWEPEQYRVTREGACWSDGRINMNKFPG
jgi:hypothetical protein